MPKISWLRGTSGTWTDGSNWSGGEAPGRGANVLFDAPDPTDQQFTVTIDSSVTVHRLELNSFGVIRQVGSETVAGSLAAEQLNFTEGALALANGTLCGMSRAPVSVVSGSTRDLATSRNFQVDARLWAGSHNEGLASPHSLTFGTVGLVHGAWYEDTAAGFMHKWR